MNPAYLPYVGAFFGAILLLGGGVGGECEQEAGGEDEKSHGRVG